MAVSSGVAKLAGSHEEKEGYPNEINDGKGLRGVEAA